MAPYPRVEDARELAGRIVAHDQPNVVTQTLERSCLRAPRARQPPPRTTTRTGRRSRSSRAGDYRPLDPDMRLEGVHHVTCITADAPRNVDFYTRVLGLRMVKKTVNQDDPTVYHLFYADETGRRGATSRSSSIRERARGRAGAGMVHTVRLAGGLRCGARLLEQRLAGEADAVSRQSEGLSFEDPEGLRHELAVVAPPTRRSSPSIRRSRRSWPSRLRRRPRVRRRSGGEPSPAGGGSPLRA